MLEQEILDELIKIRKLLKGSYTDKKTADDELK